MATWGNGQEQRGHGGCGLGQAGENRNQGPSAWPFSASFGATFGIKDTCTSGAVPQVEAGVIPVAARNSSTHNGQPTATPRILRWRLTPGLMRSHVDINSFAIRGIAWLTAGGVTCVPQNRNCGRNPLQAGTAR